MAVRWFRWSLQSRDGSISLVDDYHLYYVLVPLSIANYCPKLGFGHIYFRPKCRHKCRFPILLWYQDFYSLLLMSGPPFIRGGGRTSYRNSRDSGLNLSNRSEICDRLLGGTAAEMPFKFQSDMIIITPKVAASKLRENWRQDVLQLSE